MVWVGCATNPPTFKVTTPQQKLFINTPKQCTAWSRYMHFELKQSFPVHHKSKERTCHQLLPICVTQPRLSHYNILQFLVICERYDYSSTYCTGTRHSTFANEQKVLFYNSSNITVRLLHCPPKRTTLFRATAVASPRSWATLGEQ